MARGAREIGRGVGKVSRVQGPTNNGEEAIVVGLLPGKISQGGLVENIEPHLKSGILFPVMDTLNDFNRSMLVEDGRRGLIVARNRDSVTRGCRLSNSQFGKTSG